MTEIIHMKTVYSCGLYTMGLVKTKILLIEHFLIEIFADKN